VTPDEALSASPKGEKRANLGEIARAKPEEVTFHDIFAGINPVLAPVFDWIFKEIRKMLAKSVPEHSTRPVKGSSII
jgi:hypothetical protein